MNLGDFFTPEAGQSRRAWLDALDGRIDETLAYYLGPQLMPRVRGAVGAANELTDFADYRDAVLGADQMATGLTTADRIAGAGTMATGLAAMMVPGVSARMAEGATDVAGDLARFIADEDGGIRVWHGSPHDFDKFSMDAIGTGEGAQAYGHGLYFAENPDVAYTYRHMRGSTLTPEVRDALADLDYLGFDSAAQAATGIRSTSNWKQAWDVAGDDPAGRVVDKWLKSRPGALYEVDLHANPEDFLDWDAPLSGGELWDIGDGLSGSMDRAEEELSDFFRYSALPGDMTGREAYMWLGNTFGKDEMPDGVFSLPEREGAQYAAQALKNAGFPGIRYLDQGSRATTGGEILGVDQATDGWRAKIRTDNRSGVGFQSPTQMVTTSKPFATEAEALAWARDKTTAGTRNYVVFDENIIEIVKKYGIAGAAAMLGLSAADVEAQVAAQPVSIGDWLSNNDTATLQEYLQ